MRILIVEDEQRLAQTLADLLAENGYAADACYDGSSGLDAALDGAYDAVILDVMLPKLSGYDLLKALRDQGNHTPVLMLTARSELGDRVKGLDMGSNYYLTKPFESAELLACLRAILRRQGEVQAQLLRFDDLVLDPSTTELTCEERSVRLRAKELELMRLLIQSKGMYLPKETLMVKVWGYDSEAEGNVVEVYMTFLRKKLAHIKSRVRITAVRMVGYRLEV